ncbi:GAF domain-containing protein [Sphingomonas lutea]|uniref:GAF domain-containing protein n=1 Tax=Sphingomonas lutea TaxID=1045317 RepID=A0A7G9SJC4_9SPHN|nr:GAF domain-containing protein [Sphingomonas lutea]QNN67949.1 GAF domain-containing protein [Sphingomonas lutea]
MFQQQSARDVERANLALMFEQAPGFMALLEGGDHRIALANQSFRDLVGNRDIVGRSLADAIPEFTEHGFDEILDGVARSGEAFSGRALPLSVVRSDGSYEELLVDLVFQPLPGERRIFVQGHNVTEDKRSQALRAAHTKVLELAIGDSPLEVTLTELIKIVEMNSRTGMIGSILLLDTEGKHLHHGAAPSLPPEYSAAIDGFEIGACAGSCGTAAYMGAAVFVSDIETDPLWADFKAIALPHGLRACWSIPILTRNRQVLGTFAMYHREPREPTIRDLMLVDLITQTAALVIDRERAHAALQSIATMTGKTSEPNRGSENF